MFFFEQDIGKLAWHIRCLLQGIFFLPKRIVTVEVEKHNCWLIKGQWRSLYWFLNREYFCCDLVRSTTESFISIIALLGGKAVKLVLIIIDVPPFDRPNLQGTLLHAFQKNVLQLSQTWPMQLPKIIRNWIFIHSSKNMLGLVKGISTRPSLCAKFTSMVFTISGKTNVL